MSAEDSKIAELLASALRSDSTPVDMAGGPFTLEILERARERLKLVRYAPTSCLCLYLPNTEVTPCAWPRCRDGEL